MAKSRLKESNKELNDPFPLLAALKANDRKNLFQGKSTNFFHKTGFPLFDYYFGGLVNVHDESKILVSQSPRIGQGAGTFNQVLGGSGVGKTTITVQMAANIIRPFRNSTIHHYDVENRFDISRGANITRLPIDFFEDGPNQKYFLNQGQQSLEDIQAALARIWAEKMKLKDELTINTGLLDEFGKEIQILEPTVFIIDSISQVISTTFSPDNAKDISDMQDLRSNTAGARDAKTLKGFLKEVCPLIKEANIIVFGINHITGNMSMNAMAGPVKQQNYLKADEAIPGGRNATYSSFNMVKMTAKTSLADSFTIEGDGLDGHMVMFEPIKSSTNQSGNNSHGISFNMVFDKRHGFDSLRSLVLYAKDRGIIEGNKSGYKFKEDPSFKFAMKTIHSEKEEKPIWDCVRKYILPELEKQLSHIDPTCVKYDSETLNY